MAYVTGQQTDFASRLHELGNDGVAFGSFVIEGNSYLTAGSVDVYQSGKWELEARQIGFRLSGATFLTTPVFHSGLNILPIFVSGDPGAVGGGNLTITNTQVVENYSTSSAFWVISSFIPAGAHVHTAWSWSLVGSGVAMQWAVTTIKATSTGTTTSDYAYTTPSDVTSESHTIDFVAQNSCFLFFQPIPQDQGTAGTVTLNMN